MALAALCRGLLFVENFVFWMIGLALIVAGSYILISPDLPAFLKILEGTQVICYVALGLGVVLFVIGFLGCCGAVSENRCLLKTYSSLLIVLVLVEVGCVLVIWKFEEKVIGFLSLGWNALDSKSVDIVQQQFSCCGFKIFNATTAPASCWDSQGTLFEAGCYDKLRGVITENIVISGSVAGAIVFLQLICVVVSCLLGRKEKPPQRVHPASDNKQAWGPGYA